MSGRQRRARTVASVRRAQQQLTSYRPVPRHVLAPPSMVLDRARQRRNDEAARRAQTAHEWVEHVLCEERLDAAFLRHVVAVVRHLEEEAAPLPRPFVHLAYGGAQVNLRWENGSMAFMERGTVVVSVVGTGPMCTEQPFTEPSFLRYVRKAGFISLPYESH